MSRHCHLLPTHVLEDVSVLATKRDALATATRMTRTEFIRTCFRQCNCNGEDVIKACHRGDLQSPIAYLEGQLDGPLIGPGVAGVILADRYKSSFIMNTTEDSPDLPS